MFNASSVKIVENFVCFYESLENNYTVRKIVLKSKTLLNFL